ncbi:hypothetical protein [Acinetobacter sp. Ver3]|uniref:hypothetical protein n=1 Tax=Acinetobacter sp. Ver3 TaxID=466088 RepID=UPI0004478D97|nr:hypothetical protein [Acinetobacter sp. Ver3]EZQ12260.1 hypothetical protein CL42_01395 [Acinetobacter sp. Ver3]
MLYVIPFVVLLLIALVLKKREDKQKNGDTGSTKSKKNVSVKRAKKSPKTRSTPQQAYSQHGHGAPQDLSAEPVADELKASIEYLIQSESYMSAEAKINQALNRDPRQHELYSYLIDIHILQNDEFALKQLSNYLRSTGLHYIADEAEDKLKAAKEAERNKEIAKESRDISNSENQPRHAAQFHSTSFITEIPAVQSEQAFDHLIKSQDEQHSSQESTPTETNETTEQSSLPSQSSTFVFETEQYPHPLQAKEKKSTPEEENEHVSAEPTAHFVFSSEQLDLAEEFTLNKTNEEIIDQLPSDQAENQQATEQQTPSQNEHFELDFFMEDTPQPTSQHPFEQDDEKTPASKEQTPLEFITTDLTFEPNAQTQTESETTNQSTEDRAPLEFDLDFTSFQSENKSQTESVQSTARENRASENESIQNLDFTLDLSQEWGEKTDLPHSALSSSPSEKNLQELNIEIDPLEFNFSDQSEQSHSQTTTSKDELTFDLSDDFNFDAETSSSAKVSEQSVNDQILDFVTFDFEENLNSKSTIESSIEATNEFNFDLNSSDENVDVQQSHSHETSAIKMNPNRPDDPLVQRFPELLNVDEIQLNLDLADQYIKFGAFDEAEKLITEYESHYNDEQKMRAAKLRESMESDSN